jgi:hypothetical protein
MPEFGKGPGKGPYIQRFETEERVVTIREVDVIAYAKELSESQESFPFPGIDPEALLNMRATDIEFPGYTTPVDTLLDRCRAEGIKVIFGKYPESGNVYIVPAGRSETENEDMYIFPRHLQENEMMNGSLRTLIIADRIRFNTVRRSRRRP